MPAQTANEFWQQQTGQDAVNRAREWLRENRREPGQITVDGGGGRQLFWFARWTSGSWWNATPDSSSSGHLTRAEATALAREFSIRF